MFCTYARVYLSSDRWEVTELSLGSASFCSALGHKSCRVRALRVNGRDSIVVVRVGYIIPLQTMQFCFCYYKSSHFEQIKGDDKQRYYSHFPMSAVVAVLKSALLKLSIVFQPKCN